MNIRKEIDYSTMFAALDLAISMNLPQMELYCEIGKAICTRTEKGAAVAAASYLNEQYPDMAGFSPRNVRRMRDFYRLYGEASELLVNALRLNWTQNIVIMEAELSAEVRAWYVDEALRCNPTKAELLELLASEAHLQIPLDQTEECCYNEKDNGDLEFNQHEKVAFCVSWEYLSQPNGRVRNEGLGEEGWPGISIPHRIRSYQPGGDRQPCLSSRTAQAGRAWDLLRGSCGPATHQSGLRGIRPAHRHGSGQPAEYVPHLRRRFLRQDVPSDGAYRPPRRCGGPVVHRRLRGHLAGCAVWVPGIVERTYREMRCA